MRHVYEVWDRLQSLVDRVVEMAEEDDSTQSLDISHIVGSATTGLEGMDQHLDRCPCFKNDKV